MSGSEEEELGYGEEENDDNGVDEENNENESGDFEIGDDKGDENESGDEENNEFGDEENNENGDEENNEFGDEENNENDEDEGEEKPKKKIQRRPKERKTKTRKFDSFSTFIYKVLKQVHPDTGISNKAMMIMNSFVSDIFRRIMVECKNLNELDGKSLITSREVQTAVRLIIPGELAKHSVSEGTKACTKYNVSLTPGKYDEEKKSRSTRSGLTFPVARLHRMMKSGKYASRIGIGAPVYLAAVLEYLTAEILEMAGNASRDNKRVRIVPRHIMLAVRNDEELDKLLKFVIISGAGVLPNIPTVLLPESEQESMVRSYGMSQDY